MAQAAAPPHGLDPAEVVGAVDEDLLCAICMCVLSAPRSCQAGHTFCLDCITRALSTTQRCPIDRQPLGPSTLTRVRPLENMVQKLIVRCPNRECGAGASRKAKRARVSLAASPTSDPPQLGCNWTGKLSSRESHLEDECAFVQVSCEFNGCGKLLRRSLMETHAAKCKYRLVPCDHCEQEFAQHSMKAHLKSCDQVEIKCPMQGCQESFLREDKDRHLGLCPEGRVPCVFAAHGCTCMPKRKELGQHQIDASVDHAALMSAKLIAVEEEAAAERARLQRELRRTSADVLALSAKVAADTKAASYSEAPVRWNVKDIEAKIQAKQSVWSDGHAVIGPIAGAGSYSMRLQLEFTATHIGVFIQHLRDQGAQSMPIQLRGSQLKVVSAGFGAWTEARTMSADAKIPYRGAGGGWRTMVSLSDVPRRYVKSDGSMDIEGVIRINSFSQITL